MFSKYKISEYKAICDLHTYVDTYINKNAKAKERFGHIKLSPSSRDLWIIYDEMIIKVNYDDKNYHYYVVDELDCGNCKLEQRIIIPKERYLLAYLDYKLKQLQ